MNKENVGRDKLDSKARAPQETSTRKAEKVIFQPPHGLTGTVGIDGILSEREKQRLNQLQEETANQLLAEVNTRQPDDLFPMAAMATGIGKGKIIHLAIEKELRRKPDAKILVIAGTKTTLVEQTHESLAGYKDPQTDYITAEDDEELVPETSEPEANPLAGQRSGLYKTGKLGNKKVNVQVTTIQMVDSKIRKDELNPDDYDLVIVDEAHNVGTPKRKETINRFKRVIAFTATPHRSSGSLKKPEAYGFKVVKSYSLPEAQEEHLLPPLLGMQIDTSGLVDEIPTTMTGKIDYRKLEKVLKESDALHPFIADRLAQLIGGEKRYKTVVAVNYVWEAQKLAELLHEKGISVGIAVNKQAAKNLHTEEIPAINSIDRYKLPQDHPDAIQVLISPYVASEGFDAPFTEVLAWGSPTDSDLRYTQYTGRLPRRAPGKKFALVVDFLFQTAQYKWSYNMGMWMKGSVKQLPNGLTYLGPEDQIENLSKLPILESFAAVRRDVDRKSLEELQDEPTLPLLPTDLPLTRRGLAPEFIASTQTALLKTAQRIQGKMQATDPDFFAMRLQTHTFVPVVTEAGRAAFKAAMLAEPAIQERPKDILPIQPSDTPITGPALASYYMAAETKLASIGNALLNSLREQHPEYFAKRYTSQRKIVDVVTELGKTALDQAMAEASIQKQSTKLLPPQPGELPVSQLRIREQFRGDPNAKIAKQILKEWRTTHPEWIEDRRTNRNDVPVITPAGSEAFIQEMAKRGVSLKTDS